MRVDLPLDNKTVWASGPPGRHGPWAAGASGRRAGGPWRAVGRGPAFSKTRKKHRNTSTATHFHSTIYYHSKFNKHVRTDKIVQKILHKYHNIHLPKLSKAYCNFTKLHTLLLTNKIMHSKLSSSSKSKYFFIKKVDLRSFVFYTIPMFSFSINATGRCP